jgi:HK97 family phage major capsid protein
VVDRCTPAPSAAKVERARVEAVPFRGKLRAFKSQEEAHTVGQWIKASYCNDAHARQWCDDHGVEVRTMSESSNSAGGALVPDVMVANLIRLVDVYSVWASGMQQVPMGSDTVIFPKRVSGVTANWTGENSEISTSDPAVNQVQLVASKLTVGTKVSNEVLADSAIALGDFITEEFATAISAKLEAAAVAGDGTSTYGGVYGLKNKIGSASVHTTGAGRDTWEELVAADFLGALGKLPRYALNGARWYISSVGFALAMQRLDMAAGGRVSVEGGTGLQFAGFPVEITDQTHGTDTDFTNEIIAYFGRPDLAGMFGLRSQFATRVSTERYVEFDQTLFTGVARGTMVWHSVGDSSVAGPIVAIKGA